MSPAPGSRRPRPGRPVLWLGVLLLLPALVFGFLGWRSVGREIAVERREALRDAEDVLAAFLLSATGDLRALEAREAERPYFHYQALYAPEVTVFGELDFQPSPLAKAPDDPRLLCWFQWERGARDVPEAPEAFGPAADRLRATLSAGPAGAFLRRALSEAAAAGPAFDGRRVDHPLRVVQANEERGQLYEEMQVVRGQGREAGPGAPAGPAAPTPYLQRFQERQGAEPVPVRYSRFRYLAAAGETGPPALLAWRVVAIPASHAERREVTRDRWLLQGYALDPERVLPAGWERIGRVRFGRADLAPPEVRADPASPRASLAEALGAEVVRPPDGGSGRGAGGTPGGEAVREDPAGLSLVASPDEVLLAAAAAEARTRFGMLLLGVLAVVGVGGVVLTRGIRREIALARRKEDFVAAVTHELKTPLAGIRMHADLLREGWVADPDAAARSAGRILDECDRLGHLVDQVLDLAALERGVARAEIRPGDLAAAVKEAALLVEGRARDAEVSLQVEAPPDLPPVPFDPRLLRPLVLNLLDNAIKYSRGAPVREVRAEIRADGGRVLLSVADRGVGIAPEVRRRLFQPFQRGGDEMTRSAPGIGIGLALVKRYADAHGAAVDLQSEVGRGTTVTVSFRTA